MVQNYEKDMAGSKKSSRVLPHSSTESVGVVKTNYYTFANPPAMPTRLVIMREKRNQAGGIP